MIDLTNSALSNTVMCGGRAFSVNTDFRVWLRFAQCVENDDADVRFVFAGELPEPNVETYAALLAFFNNENPCPHDTEDASGSPVLSYDIDSEYIYAAFLQQYHIDLLTAPLHWHQFKALLLGLTDDTRMGQIMSARSYHGKDKDQNKARRAWALPVRLTESEKEKVQAFDEIT